MSKNDFFPLLPLRDIVVFPGMIAPLFVGRDKSIKALNEVPTVIVQGQYDMVCPPLTADDLYTVMPHADFRLIPDAGHSASEPGITHALIDATDIFKRYL